jgi:hypothetical protein
MRRYVVETLVMLVLDATKTNSACWTSLLSLSHISSNLLSFDIITIHHAFLHEPNKASQSDAIEAHVQKRRLMLRSSSSYPPRLGELNCKKLAALSVQRRLRMSRRPRYSHPKGPRPTTRRSLLCYASQRLSTSNTQIPWWRNRHPRSD